MNEERIKILKMVEDGKISTDEAARLLEAIGNSNYISDDVALPNGKAKWLKIKVIDMTTNKKKVNVSIPLNVAKVAIKLGAKFSSFVPADARAEIENKGIDFESLQDIEKFTELIDSISQEGPFKLIDIEDEEKNEKVEIVIE